MIIVIAIETNRKRINENIRRKTYGKQEQSESIENMQLRN